MNLTQLSKNFKKGLKILLASAILYYLATLLIIPAGKMIIEVAFPKKNPPQPIYGKLPPLTLIEKPVSEEKPVYSLNTTSGKLPTGFPDRMVIYKFKPQQTSLLKGTDAIADAEFLGFTEEDLSSDLKGNVYTWNDRDTESQLVIELSTTDLRKQTNFANYENYYPKGTLDEASAILTAENMFKKLRRFDDLLYTTGYAITHFGAISNSKVIRPANARDYQVARVDLYRNMGDYPILGQDPNKGLLHAVVKKPAQETQALNYPVVEAYYREIESESTATYPILSVGEAWKALAEDRAVITGVLPRDFNPFEKYTLQRVEKILIDDIILAYYETEEAQEFLQPIWVFKGKYSTRGTDGGDITLYYPAIRGEYIQQATPETE